MIISILYNSHVFFIVLAYFLCIIVLCDTILSWVALVLIQLFFHIFYREKMMTDFLYMLDFHGTHFSTKATFNQKLLVTNSLHKLYFMLMRYCMKYVLKLKLMTRVINFWIHIELSFEFHVVDILVNMSFDETSKITLNFNLSKIYTFMNKYFFVLSSNMSALKLNVHLQF